MDRGRRSLEPGPRIALHFLARSASADVMQLDRRGVIAMKVFLGSVICTVAMSGFSAAPAAAAASQAAAAPSDKELDTRIEHRIHQDASLKKYNIDVRVDAGSGPRQGHEARHYQGDRAGRQQDHRRPGRRRREGHGRHDQGKDQGRRREDEGRRREGRREDQGRRRQSCRQDEGRPQQDGRGHHRRLDHDTREVEVRRRRPAEGQ